MTQDAPADIEDLVRQRKCGAVHSRAYHQLYNDELPAIRQRLLSWYDTNKRAMPWRRSVDASAASSDPTVLAQRAYEVWVSEIMLQQTRVAAVVPYYEQWMKRWPTVADLAKADIEDVNRVWAGLGYYSRAKRLLEGAVHVVDKLDGRLPRSAAQLEQDIPGVGRYTAGAISSIAYGQRVPLVDGNVVRVLSRLRAVGGDPKKRAMTEMMWALAEQLVDDERPGDFNQALMELGATVCVPDKAPLCKQCPVSTHCIAYREGVTQWEMTAVAAVTPEADACDVCLPVPADAVRTLGPVYYPVKIKTNKVRDEAVAVCIVERSNGGETEYLMVQRPDKGLLAGMWEFPSVIVATTPPSEDGTLPPVPELDHLSKAMDTYFLDVLQFSEQVLVESERKSLGSLVHVFSHIRQTYFVEHLAVGDSEIKVLDTGISMKWMTATTMKDEAVPSGQCKIFALLGGKGSGASATSKKRKAEAEVATKSVRPITAFFKPKEKK